MRYLVGIAVGFLLASPAWADIAGDKRGCVRDSGWARINACSRLIQSGRLGAAHQAVAYNNRGFAYRRLKQYRRAIQDFNEALRLNPRYAGAYNNRGIGYANLKRYHRAIQDYNEALLINPRYANLYANRGLAYEQLGKKQLAIRDYRKFLSFYPGHRFGLAGLMRLGVKP